MLRKYEHFKKDETRIGGGKLFAVRGNQTLPGLHCGGIPGTSADLAERICFSIEKRAFHGPGDMPGIRVTMSIGASALHAEEDSLLELLTRADRALYTAKETGRNRVCIQA